MRRSTVGLKVDFDIALLVIASGLYRRLAQPMRGYTESQARQIFRDLVDMPADVHITDHEVDVRFHRRAHLPIVIASGLLDEAVNDPVFPTLAIPHHDHAAFEVQVLDPQSHGFHQPQPRPVEQAANEPVDAVQPLKNAPDLVDCQHDG